MYSHFHYTNNYYQNIQIKSQNIDANEWDCNIDCKGIQPVARFAHTAVAFQSNIYIFGGQGFQTTNQNGTSSDMTINENPSSFNCMYCLNTKTMEWTKMTNESSSSPLPAPRNSHTCLLYREESLIIFGGANEHVGPMDDVWSFSLTDGKNMWNRIHCCGGIDGTPRPREMHAACLDKEKDCIFVVGGRNVENNVCQDVWSLDLSMFNFILF